MSDHEDGSASSGGQIESPDINKAILSSIQNMNENMKQFMCRIEEPYDLYEQPYCFDENYEDEAVDNHESVISIQHELDEIAKGNTADESSLPQEGDLLSNYSSLLDLDIDRKGPKIADEIAGVVNKLRLNRISVDQCKTLMKRHSRPENVKVNLPKCENSIWTQLQTRTRSNDAKLQTTQQILLASLNCQLEVTNKLVSSKASKEVLSTALDGITLTMTSNYELNLRRREAIKPFFKQEFAKGLCNTTVPADEYLFGGDTSKRIKEISELQKNKVCRGQPSHSNYRGRYRFTPYSRGYRRGFRGRPAGRSSTFTSHSNYHQSDGKKSATKTWYVNNIELQVSHIINNQTPFYGGRTGQCLSEWLKLTTDPEILDMVKHCHIEFIDEPCLFSINGQRKFNSSQTSIITEEVEKLLDLGVLSLSVHENGQCISPIFVTPKPDGSHRLIFNFKNCNQAVQHRHFKMDTLNSVVNLISPGAYFASLDLKHAYYTIPIAVEQRKYLKFLWAGNLYEFNALPMGLTSSPRIFTKVMKPPLAQIRKLGGSISGYIDDFFIAGQSREECARTVDETIRLFIRLGFYVHPVKSDIVPTQSLTFLGFILNSLSMTITLTQEKRNRLKSLCSEILNGDFFPIRYVAKVIGKIVSSFPGVEFGRLHYRHLERDKIQALAVSKGDYDAMMQLSSRAREELNWWCINIMHVYRKITHPSYSHSFQVDASENGWGISCNTDDSLNSNGLWSQDQQSLHINVRELYVVFICLNIFCKDMSATHIRFEIDNTTAVAYLNDMGGCKSMNCDAVANKIWSWCIDRDLWVSAVHIPGKLNVTADALSRRRFSDHEWMLNPSIFSQLCEIFPDLTIDLFASVLNHQLPRYVSWRPDPKALYVDAFSRPWGNETFYAFPPFSLIPRCLDKIFKDQAEGLLVVPAWPTQVWYTRVLQMLTSQPLVIMWTKVNQLLIHPSGLTNHSMKHRLKLMVCLVSGNTMKSKAFLDMLPMFSSTHGDPQLRDSTQCILKNGLSSVVKGRLLRFRQL